MLQALPDGWFRYDGGRRWRCRSPGYLCEVDDAGHCPSLYREPGIAARVARVRAVYAGRLELGLLDQLGTGLDILVANAMTESYGCVPSPLDFDQLERRLDAHPELPLDARLNDLLRDIGAAAESRWLVRREPGYVSALATPSRVSVGAHHMLLSTAAALPSQREAAAAPAQNIRQQVLRLASQSLYAAQRAVEYLNRAQGQHHGQLPLLAATYNAGSPRSTTANAWHLVQYGEHIDRWIGYYNASRQALGARAPTASAREIPAPAVTALSLPAGAPTAPGNAEQLSPHFSVSELTASDKARALHIDNCPTPAIVENLRVLAQRLEQVRALLGNRALRINSAYRCPALNRAVGSKDTSMHLHGLAADFVCPDFGTPLQICNALAASSLGFDQLIHEFGRWVHLGLALPGAAERRQQLTIDAHGTRAGLLAVGAS